MRLSALKNLTAPLSLAYHGEEIALRYYTEKFFEAGFKESLNPAAPEGDAAPAEGADGAPAGAKREGPNADVIGLAQILSEWSLTDDADQPIPVSVETVNALRLEHPVLFTMIVSAVFEASTSFMRAASSPSS
jgi:hypothetical protein